MKAEQNNHIRGRFRDYHNITKNYFGGAGPDDKPLKTLIDCIRDLPDLPFPDRDIEGFLKEDLSGHVAALRKDRLLLINCSDAVLSHAAIAAVIDQLRVSPDRRKMLDFDDLAPGVIPSVYGLMSNRMDRTLDTLLVADAARVERAQPFIDSIFNFGGNLTTLRRIKALRDAGLWLICVTDPDRIARLMSSAGDLKIACWTLSSLRLMLRTRFPDQYRELESKIERQRAAGRWPSESADLHKQIASMTDAELLAAVEHEGFAATTPVDEELSKCDALHRAVLYTATFYPNLSPYEFGQVVVKLLGQQTVVMLEVTHQKGKDGVLEPVEVKTDKALAKFWREGPDAVLGACHLICTGEGKRIIAFSNAGRRDQLRRYFEQSYGVYLHDQFVAAYEQNLLFDISEQVAQDVIVLTMEMSQTYPEQFGVDWLSEVVIRACSGIPAGDISRRNLVYQRIVDLLRAMLREQTLARNVTSLLGRLLSERQSGLALQIIQRLRFAPGFDVFWWMQRVINEGTDEVRLEADLFLSYELKQPGRTYPLLYAISSWLPADSRSGTLTQSNRLALRLGFEYCLDATEAFDRRDSGAWPSRFPLFVVDADTVEPHLGLIVRWLTHPALPSVVQDQLEADDLDRIIAAFVAEWVLFLIDRSPEVLEDEAAAAGRTGLGGFSTPGLTAEAIVDVLITKLVEATNASLQRPRQQVMLSYWEELKQHVLDRTLSLTENAGRAERQELNRIRDLVRKLIARFREAQRALQPANRAQRATA